MEYVTQFLSKIRSECIDLKNLGIKDYTYDQILDKIDKCYN